VTEISKEQFGLWKHEPVTKWFFDYLINKRAFLRSAALENWVAGSQSFGDMNQTVRGQIIELEEITDLPFEAIEEFYKERETNEAETTFGEKS
jgi:hypothetical protein